MSAFDKHVRALLSAQRGTAQMEAAAEAVAAGNSIEELAIIVAHAIRAYEIKSERARAAHAAGTVRHRQALAQYGAEQGLADPEGNVSRLDVKRALRRAQATDMPVTAPRTPAEPRNPLSGVVLARPGEIDAYERAARKERGAP